VGHIKDSFFSVSGEAGSAVDPLLECGHIPDIAQIQVGNISIFVRHNRDSGSIIGDTLDIGTYRQLERCLIKK
jgi:hypothetical protein